MANAKNKQPAAEKAGPVRVKPDLEKYVRGVSGSGKKTMRSVNAVADALDGFTIGEVYSVASQLTGTSQKELHTKYDHLNVGMQRMNLGNRIRGAVAKANKAHVADKANPTGDSQLVAACKSPRAAAGERATAKAAKQKIAEKKAEDAAAEKANKKRAKAAESKKAAAA